ncbi:t-SNARE [Suillus occidentalis]|nr:t-SNARE [Suillus occidentalis]
MVLNLSLGFSDLLDDNGKKCQIHHRHALLPEPRYEFDKKAPVKPLVNGSPIKNKSIGGKVLRNKTHSTAQEDVLMTAAAKIKDHQQQLHEGLQPAGLPKLRQREASASPRLRQAQLLQTQLSPHELAYQESLIQEREADIQEIESGIHELSEIFRDLGTLVNQQGGMIDNIESNVYSIAVDTQGAAEELSTASEYQCKAGRRAACLMIILVIVVAVVLLSSECMWRNSRVSATAPKTSRAVRLL